MHCSISIIIFYWVLGFGVYFVPSCAHLCISATIESDQFGMAEQGRQGMFQLNTSQLPKFVFNGDNLFDFLGSFLKLLLILDLQH